MPPSNSNRWTTDPEFIGLLNFLIERTENVKPPMNVLQLAREFKKKSGGAGTVNCLKHRIVSVRTKIHCFEHIDTNTKVKLLFSLSSPVNPEFLKELNKDAVVKVDDTQRIIHYKSNDGSLELRGDHSQPAKRNHGKLIIDYFEKKNNTDEGPKDEEEKEMGNLIEFITEKCENIDSPLNIRQLSKDFNNHFGISRAFSCIHKKIKRYCHEIQKAEFMDTPSNVKQLFGLSARLDWDYLEKLRKDAVVEVDDLIRIKKYTSNNGLLTLHGDHSLSAKHKLAWIESEKKRKTVKNYCNPGDDEDEDGERENGYSDNDSDGYSSEEFDSEFDSDYENNYPDEPEDKVKPSKEIDDFDDGTPIRNRSPSEMSIGDNLDFDFPTEKSHRTDETEMGGDEKNDPGILGKTSVKTRYGRLSKRRHLDSEFSYDLASSHSSEAPASFESASSKPAKQKKIAIEKEQTSSSSNQSRSSSRSIRRYSSDSTFPSFSTESEENMENQDGPRTEDDPSDHGPRIQELEDYDYNPREDNLPGSSSIDNRLGEPEQSAAEEHNLNNDTQNTDNRSNAVAPELHPKKGSLAHQNETNSTPPTNGKEVNSQEVRVKVENGEPIIVEDHPEDVKPEIAHNFKIKFFEAMKSLILFLDTPSLSDLKTKIYQKIRKVKRSNEVLQNNELIPALELLIARMTNHSVINISESVESVSLVQFFCYLKASILNSKMIGVEGLLNNISEPIEKSHNKRIPMVKVVDALRATVDIDSF